MPGDEQETVTRQDLTEFRTFLLEQLKSHTSELSSKFEKASTDAESALSVSKQLKVESELKFSYPGNERNYKFNLEVLDHLENVSKTLLIQDSAEASLLLNDSIKLIKERYRKIRIADSSEGGWLTVKPYEGNAVALDLEDDKRVRAAERESLRIKTRTCAKRQNAERVQGRYPPFYQPYNLRGHFQRRQFACLYRCFRLHFVSFRSFHSRKVHFPRFNQVYQVLFQILVSRRRRRGRFQC